MSGAGWCAPCGERGRQVGGGVQAGDAALVFAVFLGVGGGEVVVARARVGVDVVVGFGFLVVVGEGTCEEVVFEQVGMVAGVVGVAVAEHGVSGSGVFADVSCFDVQSLVVGKRGR